jgi:cytochrome oxidase Cu insertion factor (SCO1/SenC/PrrC family)
MNHTEKYPQITPEQRKKGRITLFLILSTALAPIILALIFYIYHIQNPSQDTKNYGQLVKPMRAMPKGLLFEQQTQTPYQYVDGDWKVMPQDKNSLPNTAKKPVDLNNFSGKWLMVYYQTQSTCDETCVKHLYVLRQLRLSLGKDGGRLIPIWLKGESQLTPELQKLYDNPHSSLRLLKLADIKTKQPLESWLNNSQGNNHNDLKNMQDGFYLIDPRMNYMMRYPAIDEPLKIIKDLKLLLKWSRIG